MLEMKIQKDDKGGAARETQSLKVNLKWDWEKQLFEIIKSAVQALLKVVNGRAKRTD